MGKTAQVTISTTVSSTSWIPMNHHVTPFNARWSVEQAGTGDRTYSVQFTMDDPFGTPTTIYDVVSAKTAAEWGVLTELVQGLRLSTTAGSGAATLTMKVIQAGV